MVVRDGTSAFMTRGMRKGGLAARNTRKISHPILIRNVNEQGHELTGCKGGGRGVDCYQCLVLPRSSSRVNTAWESEYPSIRRSNDSWYLSWRGKGPRCVANMSSM